MEKVRKENLRTYWNLTYVDFRYERIHCRHHRNLHCLKYSKMYSSWLNIILSPISRIKENYDNNNNT